MSSCIQSRCIKSANPLLRNLPCCPRPSRCKSVFDGVEAAGGELNGIRWHDRCYGSIPMFPARLWSATDRLSQGFLSVFGNNSHRRVEPYIVSGAARPRTRPPSRQRDPVWAGTQRSNKAFREGNDERPSPLTILNGYCDCPQLLGLALRHAMDDVRRKSVPDIVGNRVIRRPGISLG